MDNLGYQIPFFLGFLLFFTILISLLLYFPIDNSIIEWSRHYVESLAIRITHEHVKRDSSRFKFDL